MHQAKLEVETVTQQWTDEVQKLRTQLGYTQQQLDSAETALAQLKREGEIKDQVSFLWDRAAYACLHQGGQHAVSPRLTRFSLPALTNLHRS